MTISGVGPGAYVNQAYHAQRDSASARPSGAAGQAFFTQQVLPEPGGAKPGEGLIHEIVEKGLIRWALEKHREELEAKIREEVMADLGFTQEELSAMSEDMRRQIEQRIEEIVRQRVQAAIRERLGAGPREAGEARGTHGRPTTNLVL